MAWSRAAWVFGGVRLISSARMMFEKIGPLMNRNSRCLVAWSSYRISVPVMSDGMRSGVNWMRLNLRWRISASVLTSRVLARPGTPRNRQCPRENRATSKSSITASCPMITLWISRVTFSLASSSSFASSRSCGDVSVDIRIL